MFHTQRIYDLHLKQDVTYGSFTLFGTQKTNSMCTAELTKMLPVPAQPMNKQPRHNPTIQITSNIRTHHNASTYQTRFSEDQITKIQDISSIAFPSTYSAYKDTDNVSK